MNRILSAALTLVLPLSLAAENLILHFDAAEESSVETADGKVIRWRNLANDSDPALPKQGVPAPEYVKDAWNAHGVVRFSGAQELVTAKTADAKSLTVFAVFRRLPAQAGPGWQQILYWDRGNVPGAADYSLTTGGSGAALEPGIHTFSGTGNYKYPFLIGSNGGNGGFLSGDLAEILVYDSADLPPEKIDAIRARLIEKWKISETDYLRTGKLPPSPERISDTLPLSDQENRGKWTLQTGLSDEFDGPLDKSKWLDMRHYTLGIPPARLMPENVVFRDGTVNLVAKYDPELPSGRVRRRQGEYHSYTVGRIFSTGMFRYGYLEARAKIQPSAFNSAFWLYGVVKEKETGKRISSEIDVFEIAGKSFAHSRSDNTALHCVATPPYSKVTRAAAWKSPFDFTKDYHVYGLEWKPDRITFYVDGAVVRDVRIKENLWDVPMRVHFDLMPHFDWFGVPDPKDFPAEFSIDYVRVWKNAETTVPDDDWKTRYELDYPAPDKGFSYDYLKKYGKDIVMLDKIPEDTVSFSVLNRSWLEGKNGAESAIALNFPASVETADSDGVQYAAPSPSWPSVELRPPMIVRTNWKGWPWLAVDYSNPGGIQSCTVMIRNASGIAQTFSMILKPGDGTHYVKLSPAVGNAPVEGIVFRIRGSDRGQEFLLRDLRLEQE